MIEKILGLLLRHGITGAGLLLVDKGYATEADVQVAAGAVVTLFGIAWSVYEKWAAKKKVINIIQQTRGLNS